MQNWKQFVIIEAASKQFLIIQAPSGLQKVVLGTLWFGINAQLRTIRNYRSGLETICVYRSTLGALESYTR